MTEYLLEPAELVFLVTTFGATSIIGIDRAVLRDNSGTIDRAEWELGYRLFQERGWLVRGDNDRYEMDRDAARMGSIIADPRLTVVSKIYTEPTAVGALTYYVGEDLIVEQAYLKAGQYRLITLDNVTTMIARMTKPLGLTTEDINEPRKLTLVATVLEQGVEAARMNRILDSARILASHSIPESVADVLVETLMSATKLAEYEIGTSNNLHGSNLYGLMLIRSSTGDWVMIYSPPFELVTIEQVNASTFDTTLYEHIHQAYMIIPDSIGG